MASHPSSRPYWSQVLRALREARGITQDGWALQIGYGRATIRRWESGETIPSADAESKIIALCREKALFKRFTDGPLAGVEVTAEWLSDLLASARLDTSRNRPVSAAQPLSQTGVPVQYAMSGDVAIAYQVYGSGPVDLVMTPGLVSHREFDWDHPQFAQFLSEMGSIGRVVIFDKRGTGMSDRVAAGTLEERMDDIRAVMDAAGMQRAALVGVSEGGPLSILFAATYPERTRALVLYGAFACEWHLEHQLSGNAASLLDEQIERIRQSWGRNVPRFLETYAPSVAADPIEQAWWTRYLTISASPGAAVALITMNSQIDVRHVLPAIRVPALVLHRRGDRATDVEHGRYLARHIEDATYVEMDGDDHLPMFGDVDRLISEIRSFVNQHRSRPDIDSVLTTIVTFETGLPGARCSTEEMILLDSFHPLMHQEIARYQGAYVRYSQTQRVVHFDGPSRAVRCALAIRDAAESQNVDIRAGLHTGEVQRCGKSISGHAVDISAQIAALAEPGEVLVSSTVTDLVAGSGFSFIDHGTHRGEDQPEQWQLFLAQHDTVSP